MATELGVAYLSVVTETGDLARSVRKQFDALDADAGRFGKALGQKLAAGLKIGTKAAAAAAEFATDFRTRSRSSPGLTPAATAPAAVVAASPRPKAVPFTAARALAMMACTALVSWPRPRSFA